MLPVFDRLRLRPGFVLRAYLYGWDDNGFGIVYAAPAKSRFLNYSVCPRDHSRRTSPPVPPEALPDVMMAIEGDDSDLSYLQASMLYRQLKEFGAVWHGCDWTTHRVLGRDRLPDCLTSPEGASGADKWEWKVPKDLDWGPCVIRGDVTDVEFYTYSGLGRERIWRFTDMYDGDGYLFHTERTEIAAGPMGYMV